MIADGRGDGTATTRRARGGLTRVMAWAVQPYICLGLLTGGLVVAAWPHEAAPPGHAAIEDAPTDGDQARTRAWGRRHRDGCASCRLATEDSLRNSALPGPPA